MSLRALPPKQRLSRRWNHLRYVPLIILVIISIVAALVGAVVARQQNREAAQDALPAPLQTAVNTPTSTDGALPALCHPAVPAPARQPWLGSAADKAKAEAVWTNHQSELMHPYVLEKDGWVDWGDVQAANFSQAIGRRNLSTAEATKWHDHLAKLRDSLAALHTPLYIVVTPAKWDVYPQQLPSWAQKIRGSGPIDQLEVNYPDLPIVDLRAPLRAASVDHQTYSKTNSHWSDYGAWVGWRSIAECIDATSPGLAGISAAAIGGVSVEADANEFAPFGIPDPAPNRTVPDYTPALGPVTVTTSDGTTSTVAGNTPTDLLKLPSETTTTTAQTRHTALFVRDSFGSALSIPLQQSFTRTWQVRHNLDGPLNTQPDIAGLAKQYRPDVVILQIAERHLNFVPSS